MTPLNSSTRKENVRFSKPSNGQNTPASAAGEDASCPEIASCPGAAFRPDPSSRPGDAPRKVMLLLYRCSGAMELQEYIAKSLGFPEYYGKNLDALYDMLTGGVKALELELVVDKDNSSYCDKVTAVFLDAAKENPRLEAKVTVREEEERDEPMDAVYETGGF